MLLFFRPKFELYTEQARRVIFFAVKGANSSHSRWFQPEHLLLGLFRENPRAIHEVMPASQAQLLRDQLEARAGQGADPPASKELPLSRATKLALKAAESAAKRHGHPRITSRHILAGLADSPGETAGLLMQYGLDRAALDRALGAELE